jgi:biopolymer transport protein TolQ
VNIGIDLSGDLSFIELVRNASLVVQVVMGLLLLVSLMSWWYIFLKWFAIRADSTRSEGFEKVFWSGGDLNELYQRATESRKPNGMERMFESGFREFVKLKRQPGMSAQAIMEGTRRAMRATYQREMDRLDSHLSFLATVGSVSPYVGLFGTVWGIMNAFRGLSTVAQATLAQVAPGIAEALIATAMGLFAAIPAVVAYNRFTHDLDRLAIRYDSFSEEFSNILQRQAHKA